VSTRTCPRVAGSDADCVRGSSTASVRRSDETQKRETAVNVPQSDEQNQGLPRLVLNLAPGQRVPVRVAGNDDVWLFVTAVTPLPPVVWVTMGRRMRVAR
jgi:hypothetical protein